MHESFKGWSAVAELLQHFAHEGNRPRRDGAPSWLNPGQQASLRALAQHLPAHGVLIADEVGMGKTRIAAQVARAVAKAGGRVAILVPPGLGYQWRQELQDAQLTVPPILRSQEQYFSAWSENNSQPWFEKPVLLLSHQFSNWSLGASSPTWRWWLNIELLKQWEKPTRIARPREHCKHLPNVCRAAHSIHAAIVQGPQGTAFQSLKALIEGISPSKSREAANYYSERPERRRLEQAVGLGLGQFDLVIVDEAHKSRSADSKLSVLLNRMIQRTPSQRVLAMTATPVELDSSQWDSTLSRLGVSLKDSPPLKKAIEDYADAVKKVRQTPSRPATRAEYARAAKAFEHHLAPHVLRRDKREDEAVIAYAEASRQAAHSYRRIENIDIPLDTLDLDWKRALCAVEAMAAASRQGDAGGTQRLRLTIGNGHGMAAMLLNDGTLPKALKPVPDQIRPDDALAPADESDFCADPSPDGSDTAEATAPDSGAAPEEAQRLARVRWWRNTMVLALHQGRQSLFDHPALLACIQAIEKAHGEREKVLVFGRFLLPLRALVQLLNAREMLRCLQNGRGWPQEYLHEGSPAQPVVPSERPEDPETVAIRSGNEVFAVEAALRQMNIGWTVNEVRARLQEQYKALTQQRRNWRTTLIETLEEGLGLRGKATGVAPTPLQQLFLAFKASATAMPIDEEMEDQQCLPLLGKALHELMVDIDQPSPGDLAKAFEGLIDALSDRNEFDDREVPAQHNYDAARDRAAAQWQSLRERLREEYRRPEGSFARLMFGGTDQAARRMLQLAFNRPASQPRVLVAQSMVGREGLNLHTACSTVVLLHPEWNPGVVEQQIGRVDRVNSHWAMSLRKAIANGVEPENLPRIRIRPVVFQGTYDEHNWQVLNERWDDLRAQLHGVVIPPRVFTDDPELQVWAKELELVAPNFSPRPFHAV